MKIPQNKQERNKKYREENKEKIKLYQKEYRKKNREDILKKRKEYRDNNKEKIAEEQKNHHQKNREDILKKRKEHRKNNKQKYSERQKLYYKNNKEAKNKKLKRDRDYSMNNRKKINDNRRIRKEIDLNYKFKCLIRSLISTSFKKNRFVKPSTTIKILGCSFEEFKAHLESKFESWMNWDNHGLYNGELNYGWDIDHIIPSSSAINEDDIIKLNHYSNLQPLCSKINRDIKRNNLF